VEQKMTAATVWVYPEREFRPLGAVRYQVTWEEVKPRAKDKDELDHDLDINYRFANYNSKDDAMKFARAIVDSCKTAYGQATVTRQVVDWFVEEDRVAEWCDTKEVEYVD
jgi:hypothetical protein